MPLQQLPPAAEHYGREQRREIGAALAAIQRQWRRMSDDFDASYAAIEPAILAVMDSAQRRVSAGAAEYVPEVLSETAPRTLSRSPDYDLDLDSLTGTAGDGMPTDSMAYGAVTRAKTAVGDGSSVAEALRSGGHYLTTAVGTMLSDTARTVEQASTLARANTGFVRMLEPPSCGRCIILAGKRFRSQTAFLRHPKCDCRNIPAAESIADDLMVSPETYLSTLDDDQLARALGSRANAQAWQDGVDTNQLINAYRKSGDVRAAQVYGRTVKYTTEGTTRRGMAYRAMSRAGYVEKSNDVRAGRYFRARAPRLMPASIYSIAKNRDDAKRLLRLYGWIT